MAIEPLVLLLAMTLAGSSCCCFRGAQASSTVPDPSLVCGSAGVAVFLSDAIPFCGTSGISCCDAAQDAELREQFEAMDIADATCGAVVKALLCARCNPSLSGALLFNTVDLTKLCPSTPSSSGYAKTQQHHPLACLERISAGSYFAMAAHPDGSGRVFLSTQDGKIWLASMPKRGRRLHGHGRPFLDLTGAVVRLVGVAFHPQFTTNGRFFVSYKCDCSVSPACGGGRCWPVAAAATNGSSRHCGYQLVVSEFAAATAKGGVDFSKAARAEPCEVRRILTLDLPPAHTSSTYSYQQHGGQIMFRPGDRNGYLYVITGHGGFSKNRGALLGVILRFDVGRMLPADGGRGGGSSRGTPKMVIVAMGLDNPSGCSFDSDWPFHLYCANVDQLQQFERVYEIKTGGNHNGSTLSIISDHGHPTDGRMPSIVGGILYRGFADPNFKGRYMYMYASGLGSTTSPTSGAPGAAPCPAAAVAPALSSAAACSPSGRGRVKTPSFSPPAASTDSSRPTTALCCRRLTDPPGGSRSGYLLSCSPST